MNFTALRKNQHFELIYRLSVIVKGIDGLVELIAGILLLTFPRVLHDVLSGISGHALRHHSHTYHFIGEYVARLDKDLAKSGVLFLTVFLIGHGLVKLVLVYCLLKKFYKGYPYALVVLGGFLAYQLYVLVRDPTSIGMWIFTILDILIIWIVWGEYQDLREKHGIIHTDAKDTSVL